MGTFLSILGFIFLLIILKFVYDTYLTNNTEKRWQKHIKHNKEDAEYFESKYGQTSSGTPKLKYRGLYFFRRQIVVKDEVFRSAKGMFFTDTDAFLFKLKDEDFDMPIEDIKTKLHTLFTKDSFAKEEFATEYQLQGNILRLRFEYSGTSSEEFEGEITNVGILFNSQGSAMVLGIKKNFTISKNDIFEFYPL